MAEGGNVRLGRLSQYEVIYSREFVDTFRALADRRLRDSVLECVADLAASFQNWGRRHVKKPLLVRDRNRPIRTGRIDDGNRLIFEGPVQYDGLPTIFVHTFSHHDDVERALRAALRHLPADETTVEFEFAELGDVSEEPTTELDEQLIPFSVMVDTAYLADTDQFVSLLQSSKAGITYTPLQRSVLRADPPLFIEGLAGSGKTTLLCLRLALLLQERERWRAAGQEGGEFIYLSYSPRLVEQARRDTSELLDSLTLQSATLSGVRFLPFQDLLRQFAPSEPFGDPLKYMSYGRFQRRYELYRRGSPYAKSVSPEEAWHSIRSILKGRCVPPQKPPLSEKDYLLLAERQRDIPHSKFEAIYRIAEWYVDELHKRNQWDDQDVAWQALRWLRQARDSRRYAAIFCDEAQDLTQLEFTLLRELCEAGPEGPALFVAGDPLQTINPSGFNWEIRADVYRVANRPVELHRLRENFRSDRHIVNLANEIQRMRSRATGEANVAIQDAFERRGDLPHFVEVEHPEDFAALAWTLSQLPTDSAVVVWPEEEEELTRLVGEDPGLAELRKDSADIDLFIRRVTEAKGLEFRLVVLYRFGTSPDFSRWFGKLHDRDATDADAPIALRYFFNRLYVSVTRAKSYLFIVDSREALDGFWSELRDQLNVVPRGQTGELLRDHMAFTGADDPAAFLAWGETLLERAERDQSHREYRAALSAFEKGGSALRAAFVRGRLAEIDEHWLDAGNHYLEVQEYERAGLAFERAQSWEFAVDAYEQQLARSPATPSLVRRHAIARFNRDLALPETRELALEELWQFIETSGVTIDASLIRECADKLGELKRHSESASLYRRLSEGNGDPELLRGASRHYYLAGQYPDALKTLSRLGSWDRREFPLCHALEIETSRPVEAARIYLSAGQLHRVLDLTRGGDPEALELRADAQYRLGRIDEAIASLLELGVKSAEDVGPRHRLRLAELYEQKAELANDSSARVEAFDIAMRARAWGVARRLAEKTRQPAATLARIDAELALQAGDRLRAAQLLSQAGDQKRSLRLTAEARRSEGSYGEAIETFAQIEAWTEVLDTAVAAIDARAGDSTRTSARAVEAASRLTRLNSQQQRGLGRAIEVLREDEDWEKHVNLPDFGQALVRCDRVTDAADFFERHMERHRWALDGWLRAKWDQYDRLMNSNDPDREGKGRKIRYRVEQEALRRGVKPEDYRSKRA